jgi:hypothetical protein
VIMSALPRGRSGRSSGGGGGDSETAMVSAHEPLLPRAAAAASGMHPPGGPGAGVAEAQQQQQQLFAGTKTVAEVSLPGVGSVPTEPGGGTIEWRGVAVVMLLDFVFYTAAASTFSPTVLLLRELACERLDIEQV